MTDDLSIPPFLDRTGDKPSEEQHADRAARRPSWRDHLKIHPAAELFPLMSEPELRELGEDIKKNGLRQTIIYCKPPGDKNGKPVLLDGRNRLDAMELVGIATVDDRGIVRDKNGVVYNGTELAYPSLPDQDPYELVLSLNIQRRHLTAEQKRELIAKLLKAKPGASNRQIAKQVKAHHTTVGTVRAEMESTGEISQLEKTVGADGKSRPKTKKAKKPRYMTAGEEWKSRAAEQRATGSAEVSADERREYYAATENPTTVDDQAVEILPPAPKDGNPIWLAWCKAKPSQRTEFVKLGWVDIMRVRHRIGGDTQS